ncbi:hypothetical protein [Pseudomonas viridiflava]|uniref:hypothetical protein n=2 Tax=Pseudomonas viridiflava TaxID=33069 RepID=UPI000F032AE3|nr:hypothetical protein [Pseudomonas viridiflava]MCJ8175090.1 hypothetical protein [Pseudomonas viridiflava]
MSTLTVTLALGNQPSVLPPASEFHYVDQGNYQTFELESGKPLVAYSDSATSCIITAVITRCAGRNTLTLAHLDSPQCIEAFFAVVATSPADDYQVFAQGANPPDNDTAKSNAAQLHASVQGLGSKVSVSELSLLQGDPRQNNRGDFGVAFEGADTALATNQPYTLQLYQRDPTCGGQTVYCIMRRQENPPVQIRDGGLPFTHAQLVELSAIAIAFRKDKNDAATAFTNIVNLESEEIRQNWSTTPEYEAPWFSDQLKLGAAFAIAMSPVVLLSGQHLIKTTPPTFSRLRKALQKE